MAYVKDRHSLVTMTFKTIKINCNRVILSKNKFIYIYIYSDIFVLTRCNYFI